MGTSLVGLLPQNTYVGLIKVGNNTALNATLKTLSDGAGNDLPMQASTTAINFTGTTTGLASGVSGAIQFSNGSAFASDASNLFWDDTNNRLGVGTNTPSSTVDINSNTLNNAMFSIGPSFATGFQIFNTNSTGTPVYGIGLNPSYINTRIGFYDTLTFRANGTQIAEMTSSEVCIGSISGARVGIKGSGSTSATTSLLVQTSAGLPSLQVLDSRSVRVNGGSGNGLTLEVGGTLEATGSSYLRGQSYGFSGFFAGMNSGESAVAIIQADSTTKGFLPPRMTTTQKNAIASPATGLQVFDSTMNATCEYNGTGWRVVSAGSQSVTVSGLLQTVSLADGNVLNITLNSSTTFTFTNPTIGTYILKLTQGTGGGFLVTWPGTVLWSGGTAPTLTTTAAKTDIITLVYDGTNYYGNYSLNY